MTAHYKLAIFDFDGTLVDSVPGILNTIKIVVKEQSLSDSILKNWSHLVGMPLYRQMEILFPDQPIDFHQKIIKSYRQYSNATIIENCPPFPGLKETIDKLSQERVLLTIASSKSNLAINKVMNHHNIVSYFNLIVGLDDVSKHKPDPEAVHKILSQYNIKPEEAIVIGDSKFDIEMANNAGVSSIAVTTGIHSRELLAESFPTYVVDRLEDTLSIILR